MSLQLTGKLMAQQLKKPLNYCSLRVFQYKVTL